MSGYAKLCEKYYGVPKIVAEMAHILEKKDKNVRTPTKFSMEGASFTKQYFNCPLSI